MFCVQDSQKKSSSAGNSSYSPVSAAGSLERGQGQQGSRVHVIVGVCVTATAMCSIRQAADDAEAMTTCLAAQGKASAGGWQAQLSSCVSTPSDKQQMMLKSVAVMIRLSAVHATGSLSGLLSCVRTLSEKQQMMLAGC